MSFHTEILPVGHKMPQVTRDIRQSTPSRPRGMGQEAALLSKKPYLKAKWISNSIPICSSYASTLFTEGSTNKFDYLNYHHCISNLTPPEGDAHMLRDVKFQNRMSLYTFRLFPSPVTLTVPVLEIWRPRFWKTNYSRVGLPYAKSKPCIADIVRNTSLSSLSQSCFPFFHPSKRKEKSGCFFSVTHYCFPRSLNNIIFPITISFCNICSWQRVRSSQMSKNPISSLTQWIAARHFR